MGLLQSALGRGTQTPSPSPGPNPCYKMQGRLNELCKCAQRICLTLGVQPKTWVQLGSINARIPYKIVIHQVRRAKTNQRDSKLESSYEPEGREFESLRAHYSSSSFRMLRSEEHTSELQSLR